MRDQIRHYQLLCTKAIGVEPQEWYGLNDFSASEPLDVCDAEFIVAHSPELVYLMWEAIKAADNGGAERWYIARDALYARMDDDPTPPDPA